LLSGLDFRRMTSLCLVDCPIEPETLADDTFDGLALRTLVMSGTGIRRLPAAVLRLSPSVLETLKIDRNRLGPELPSDVIGRFVSLRTFICDAQRPRLRRLPRALVARLTQLEVLSVADNRIPTDDLDWVADSAPRLRVFICSRNKITRIPTGLDRLDRLAVFDASHNRIDELPPKTVGPLVGRLARCDLYNSTLFRRPEYRSMRRCDMVGLSTHFLLDQILTSTTKTKETTYQRVSCAGSSSAVINAEDATEPAATVDDRDVTIVVVGESRAGKRTLIETMATIAAASTGSTATSGGNATNANDRRGGGSSRQRQSSSSGSSGGTGGLFTIEFDVRQPDGGTCHVTALAVSGDELADEYIRQVRVDLFLLAFDLQNACSEPVAPQSNGPMYHLIYN
jgi:hypothetical protein